MTMFLNILTVIHPTFAFIFLALIGINLVLLGWTFGFSNGLKRGQDSAFETVQLEGGE
jgi:hypothetical protein